MSTGARTHYLRENVRAFPEWKAPPTPEALARMGFDVGGLHRLGVNESPYPPAPAVIAAIRAEAESVNRYPDAASAALAEAIAAHTGIARERVVVSAGTEELMGATFAVALDAGDTVVIPTPTFPRYANVAALAQARLVQVPNRADGTCDVEGLLAAKDARTRILLCVTPNNPSGGMSSAEDIARLAAQTPDNVILMLDEAYHEFGVHAGGPDSLPLLKSRTGPWVVTRSFSKAYALAGLRVGYALCSSEDVARALRWSTLTFNVSTVAQAAARAALAEQDYLRYLLDRCAEERARTAAGLRALQLAPLPSAANFVSVSLPISGRDAMVGLLKRKVSIVPWMDQGYETYIRVTMGTAADTDAFLAALKEVLDEAR